MLQSLFLSLPHILYFPKPYTQGSWHSNLVMYNVHLPLWLMRDTSTSCLIKLLLTHTLTYGQGPRCVFPISSRHMRQLSVNPYDRTMSTQAASTEPKLVTTLMTTFRLCHCSFLLVSFFFLMLLFPRCVFPPHPSLHFWLSRMSRRQGHLTAVAVETKNLFFFPPLFPSPHFMYCKMMRYTEVWDKRSNDQVDMTKVKKTKAAAILVDVRLEKKPFISSCKITVTLMSNTVSWRVMFYHLWSRKAHPPS